MFDRLYEYDYTIDRQDNKLRITVFPRKSCHNALNVVITIVVLLGMALFASYSMLVAESAKDVLGDFCWFASTWLLVFFIVLWQTTGSETIEIDGRSLTIQRRIGSLLAIRNAVFHLDKIGNMRIAGVAGSNSFFRLNIDWLLWWRGSFLFEYGSRMIRFGPMLSIRSAVTILSVIKKYCSQHSVTKRW